MVSMRYYSSRFVKLCPHMVCALALASVVLGTRSETQAQGHGVSADPGVQPVPLSSLQGLQSDSLWDTIDGLEFWAVPLEPPAEYYDSVDPSSRSTLRATLHGLIDDHQVFRYSHRSRPDDNRHVVDTWDIIALADAHPENPERVLDIYLNGTFDRQLRGKTTDPRYDREHSWPKSLGFPDQTTKNPAYSDCHHLFAAFRSYNGSRSNKPYGALDPDAERRKPTLENIGRGGSLTDEPDSSNYSFGDVWQTWIGRRGEVARAMFYLDVRYEGGPNEADLQLTEELADVEKLNVWKTGGDAFMGLLPVLLQWHEDDPVDDLERRRNTVVFLFQGNRNPFVDHPEWVDVLFGDGEPPGNASSGEAVVWINEFHYDNQGADRDEFVELAGPAGSSLDGWVLVGYNGSGGRGYRTIVLNGLLTGEMGSVGFSTVDFAGLQNGPSDGLALVDPDGNVVQLISYEGSFTATDGPAEGMDAENIGVAESGSTPAGESLQLTSLGAGPDDFTWANAGQSTPGVVNTGQSFR